MRPGLGSGSVFLPLVFIQPSTSFTLPLAQAPTYPHR